jgi:hypothetical protein
LKNILRFPEIQDFFLNSRKVEVLWKWFKHPEMPLSPEIKPIICLCLQITRRTI